MSAVPLPPSPPRRWPPVYVKPRSGSRVFRLIVGICVMAIIALLAAIVVPSIISDRKRSQAVTIKHDLRLIDDALDRYAFEWNATTGSVRMDQLKKYFGPGTRLTSTNVDARGNPYPSSYRLPHRYGEQISPDLKVPAASKAALAEMVDDRFWSPYQ